MQLATIKIAPQKFHYETTTHMYLYAATIKIVQCKLQLRLALATVSYLSP